MTTASDESAQSSVSTSSVSTANPFLSSRSVSPGPVSPVVSQTSGSNLDSKSSTALSHDTRKDLGASKSNRKGKKSRKKSKVYVIPLAMRIFSGDCLILAFRTIVTKKPSKSRKIIARFTRSTLLFVQGKSNSKKRSPSKQSKKKQPSARRSKRSGSAKKTVSKGKPSSRKRSSSKRKTVSVQSCTNLYPFFIDVSNFLSVFSRKLP